MGVVDEVGGFADEAADGLDGFAEAGVEAVAVECGLSGEVAVLDGAQTGVVLGKFEEGAGGVGGLGGQLAGTGQDQGVYGVFGGAPGFFSGVSGVSGCKLPEGGVVHVSGVGEDGWGVGCGGGHGWGIIARGVAPRPSGWIPDYSGMTDRGGDDGGGWEG